MTSVEVPYSIAAALPSLAVLDITNDVAREVGESVVGSGIVYISAGDGPALVRVTERESGFFTDLECLLDRLVPLTATPQRARMLAFLLGPRTEQIPFSDRRLCLGRWQRVLLFSFDEAGQYDWTLTVVG